METFPKSEPRPLTTGHYTPRQSSAGNDPALKTQGIPKERGEFKKNRLEEAIRRKRFKQMALVAGAVLVLAILVIGIIVYNQRKTKNLPGQLIPDQGREHVGSGHQHTYNSNPPTSGWHHNRPSDWGVYKEELPDEVLIHNMEHGGVWISYRPEISEDMRKKLESFYDKFGRKIIVTPRAQNDTDIALAAWNRLDKFSAAEYSDERVEKFIKAFRNRGPEFVP